MPIYVYWCDRCRKSFDFLVRNLATHQPPSCPKCGRAEMQRRLSSFSAVRSEESRMEGLADPSALAGLDEKDPRSLARWMRKASKEIGEELGPEFDEVCARLESGEDPEKIEESMGELGLGGEGGGMDDGGLYDG